MRKSIAIFGTLLVLVLGLSGCQHPVTQLVVVDGATLSTYLSSHGYEMTWRDAPMSGISQDITGDTIRVHVKTPDSEGWVFLQSQDKRLAFYPTLKTPSTSGKSLRWIAPNGDVFEQPQGSKLDWQSGLFCRSDADSPDASIRSMREPDRALVTLDKERLHRISIASNGTCILTIRDTYFKLDGVDGLLGREVTVYRPSGNPTKYHASWPFRIYGQVIAVEPGGTRMLCRNGFGLFVHDFDVPITHEKFDASNAVFFLPTDWLTPRLSAATVSMTMSASDHLNAKTSANAPFVRD